MVTIFERCSLQGFTDYPTTSLVGDKVSQKFISDNLHGRVLTESVEPHGTFEVWAYPDSYAPEIDKVIKEVNIMLNSRVVSPSIYPNNTVLIEGKPKRKRI
jgi:hypothetical protein